MERIKGNYNEVKAKILDEYNSSDCAICEYFSSIICEDLSIEENMRLYAELRDQCDGDLVVNIIDIDCIVDLGHDKNMTLTEVIKKIK